MTAYGVLVNIGGAAIPSAWDGGSVAALDNLVIDWGRETPYDDQEPRALRMDVLASSSRWFDRTQRIGQAVIVRRTGGSGDRRVFRGVVTDLTAERRHVRNPATDRDQAVWIVHLTCQDKLGQAGGVVVDGPMGSDSYEGKGGWGEDLGYTRLAKMDAAGALDLFSGGWTLGEPDEADYRSGDYWWGLPADKSVVTNLHGIKGSDAPTTLELLHGIMHARAGAAIEYNPERDRVGPVASYVTGGGVRFVRPTPSTVGIAPADSSRLAYVSARRVGTPDGYDVSQTVTDAIDSVTVTGFYYGKETLTSSGGIEYKEISMSGTLSTQGTASRNLTNDMRGMQYDPSIMSGVTDNNKGMPWVLDQTLALARRLNGWMQYPTLEFDQRRLPIPDDVAEMVFDSSQSPRALYFSGSVLADLASIPGEVQMIGGTLSYVNGGWTQRPNLMPAVEGVAGALPGLPITGLFGSSSVRWEQFDDSVTWADFGYVTIGLTA